MSGRRQRPRGRLINAAYADLLELAGVIAAVFLAAGALALIRHLTGA